tara:strand:+ start:243 stop:1661 length:1419 start_codon:yes stop_codon:yes gene_type:complete
MSDTSVKKRRGRPRKKKEETGKVEIKVAKKRGRKPKKKDPNEKEVTKIPKKRGRKPKNKVNTVEVKVLKKRGRKPKDKSYGIIQKKESGINNSNIIIHLPIKTNNINNNLKEKELLTYTPDLPVPKGYEDQIAGNYVDNCQFLKQKNNPNKNGLTADRPLPNASYCYYPFDEKHQDIFEVLENNEDNGSEDSTNNSNLLNIENSSNVEHKDNWFIKQDAEFIENNKGIDKIMDYIRKERDKEKDNFLIKQSRNNVENCLIQMCESNKTNVWPSCTSIYCWWCSHPFEGPPCSLPCDYKNNTYSVCGIFCSPECAAAYNFNDTNSGYDLWERYSLLNLLYRQVYNDNNIKIKLAPDKLTLKIFGGNLSIKEFRSYNSNYDVNFKIVMPPMISIIPVQELSSINIGYSSKLEKKKYQIMNKENNDDTNSNQKLRLKRNKPFNFTKNTLEKCMLINSDDKSENNSFTQSSINSSK